MVEGRTGVRSGLRLHSDRLLIVDASLSKRLSTELSMRGRRSVSAAADGVGNYEDPDLLRYLARQYGGDDYVLITSDDKMPDEHGALISELGITIATIDGRWAASGLEQEAWKREVVHRWAHAMHDQPPKSIRRYSLKWYREWTKRRSDYDGARRRADATDAAQAGGTRRNPRAEAG